MKNTEKTGILYGIGVGPGDPELVTLKAVRIVGECDTVILPAKSKEDCIGVHPSSVADSNRLAGIPSKKFLINTRLYTFSAGNKITTQMVLVKCNDFNTR